MKFSDALAFSMNSALRGKARSLLSVCAIAIGVASVILILSIGEGSRTAIAGQLDKIGMEGVLVYPKESAANAGVALQPEDADYLKNRIPSISTAMPLSSEYGSYQLRNWQGNAFIYGADTQMLTVLGTRTLYGRCFSEPEVQSAAQVVLISESLARTVYGRENIVGKTMVLSSNQSSREFEIIGVLPDQTEAVTQLVGEMLPEFIYVPHTALQALSGNKGINQIILRGETGADSVGERAVRALNGRYEYP
ncbi:ABC transporter permease, partial [Oscillospiraceae bacterium OttesenSCG-928-F05]|nr:ABC transporter permease [Oscillospiraceae bacterium OttesenSCG-928-F05]